MSYNDSFLSATWSSKSAESPITSFSSSSSDVRRSRSRRRRSSIDEHDRSFAKSPRTGVHYDAVPHRQRSGVSLCSSCRRLDLHGLFTSKRRITSISGQFISYLDWVSDPDCALCLFLRMMCMPPLHGATTSEHDDADATIETGYQLRAFSGMLSYREYFKHPPTNMKISESTDTMLAVVPNNLSTGTTNTNQPKYEDTFGSVGYILPVAYSSLSPWLTGRPVYATQINFPLIQEWLQHCKKKHSCAMRFSRPLQLRMIDCKTLEIVTAPPNCNYFALSYVWGDASKSASSETSTTSLPSDTRKPLSDAAPVVRDAMEVVRSLGGRYLWVDKYCIPQADPLLKAEQLGRMDLIYEGAYCTIIAASGRTDQDGLPGISVPRHAQPTFSTDGCNVHFVSSLPDPQVAITLSKWNTRAWTFQEALCSGRRLVFTRHQLYFECKAMHTCEAVELPLSLVTGAHARPVLFRDEWLTGTHRFGALSAFWAAVQAYSQRSITFESDALIALEGILRRFQSSPAFVYNIFGIPVVLERGSTGDKDTLLDPRLFIAGLSWYHAGAARRRKHFPSWTWAGWEGCVQSQRTFGGTSYASNLRLWVRDSDGVTYPWNMYWEGFWSAEGKAECCTRFKCLVVEADIFKVQLIPREDDASTEAVETTVFDMVSPYDSAVRFSPVTLPANLASQSKTTTELWDCMVMGTKAKRVNPDVMLIRWDVDIAERVWAGTLWPDKWSSTGFVMHPPPLLRRKFKLS